MAKKSSVQNAKRNRAIFSMLFMIGALAASVGAVMYGTGYLTGAFRRGSTITTSQLCELTGSNVTSLTSPVAIPRGYSPTRQMGYIYTFGRTVDGIGMVSSSFAMDRVIGKPCDGLKFVTVKDIYSQSQFIKKFAADYPDLFSNSGEVDGLAVSENVEGIVSQVKIKLIPYFQAKANNNGVRFSNLARYLDGQYMAGFGYPSGLLINGQPRTSALAETQSNMIADALRDILNGIKSEKVRQMIPPRSVGIESGVTPLSGRYVPSSVNKVASLKDKSRYVVYYYSVQGTAGSYAPISVGVAVADVDKSASNIYPVFKRYDNLFPVSSDFANLQVSGFSSTDGTLMLWGTSIDGKSGMRYARVKLDKVAETDAYEFCKLNTVTGTGTSCLWVKTTAEATVFHTGEFPNATVAHDYTDKLHLVLYGKGNEFQASNIGKGFLLGHVGLPVDFTPSKKGTPDYVRVVDRSYTQQKLVSLFNYLTSVRTSKKDVTGVANSSIYLNQATVTEPDMANPNEEEMIDGKVIEVDDTF